jgi:hypothetical protein
MIVQRFSVPVLLAAAVLVSGCKKKDPAVTSEPAGSAAPAPAPPAPAAAPPAAAPPAATGDSDSVVPLAKLAAITLPPPQGAPAGGRWRSAPSPTGGTGDGDRLANFIDGSDFWVSVRFLDCNLPAVKASASKPTEGGEFTFCFDKPTGKLKDYPLFNAFDTQRVVKVGHLVIIASLGATGETKLKATDLEAFLESLDLAAIAKL